MTEDIILIICKISVIYLVSNSNGKYIALRMNIVSDSILVLLSSKIYLEKHRYPGPCSLTGVFFNALMDYFLIKFVF